MRSLVVALEIRARKLAETAAGVMIWNVALDQRTRKFRPVDCGSKANVNVSPERRHQKSTGLTCREEQVEVPVQHRRAIREIAVV